MILNHSRIHIFYLTLHVFIKFHRFFSGKFEKFFLGISRTFSVQFYFSDYIRTGASQWKCFSKGWPTNSSRHLEQFLAVWEWDSLDPTRNDRHVYPRKAYLELCQTSKMECLILDVWQGSENASAQCLSKINSKMLIFWDFSFECLILLFQNLLFREYWISRMSKVLQWSATKN